MKRFPRSAGALALSALIYACIGQAAVSPSEGAGNRPLKVLTSILPVYCFVAQVAGVSADVENLLSGKVGPHEFQLAPKDAQKLTAADLIFVNGLGLETWIVNSFGASEEPRSHRVIPISAGLSGELIGGTNTEPGNREKTAGTTGDFGTARRTVDVNPHIWLDPRLAIHAVANIRDALQKSDPAHSDRYAQNASNFVGRLEQLDEEIRTLLEPVRHKAFVTQHDAFAYFVRRYGLNLAGILERVPDVEPSVRELAGFYKTIRDQHVRVIFTEPQFSSRLVRQIARDLDLKVAELDPMETGEPTPDAYENGLRSMARQLRKQLE